MIKWITLRKTQYINFLEMQPLTIANENPQRLFFPMGGIPTRLINPFEDRLMWHHPRTGNLVKDIANCSYDT